MRRQLAEWLFESILDEDFTMGVREGRRQTKDDLTFKLEVLLQSANKTKAPGISQALEMLRNHR